jgi:hypothetical protein
MSNNIFDNLVEDVTAKVLEQVQQQLFSVVTDTVNARIESLVNSNIVSNAIDNRIDLSIAQYHPDMTSIDAKIQSVVGQLSNGVAGDLNVHIQRMVSEKLNSIDVDGIVNFRIQQKIENSGKIELPKHSIDLEALDLTQLTIGGDQVSGGVIKNFGSTGIDDQATECKVTILDQGTVFENTLYAPRIEVKGGALIDGDLEILGNIVNNSAYQQIVSDAASSAKETITDEVLQQHQAIIFDRIQNEGLDLSKVTFNGRTLVDNDRLVGVVNSQLRTVGTLQDLQTSGETLLSETMYTTNKRVGINTMDPKTALSVWDEEIEIGIGKNQKGIGRISVERENSLILGSNGNDNVTLNSDGSTTINTLKINNMSFTTAQTPPSYSAQRGAVVFNENPTIGGPLGWVSLGDARWANFGIID